MHVAFRVDASRQIGTGHVSRCLALAEELRLRGFEVTIISRAHEGHVLEHVRAMRFNVHVLPASEDEDAEDNIGEDYARWLGVSQSRDAEETLEALAGLRPHWLVVDHYGLSAHWEERLRPHVGRLMVIDDLANRRHDCDVLLDQSYAPGHEGRYTTLTPAECRVFLGPRYALLRREYSEVREEGRHFGGEPRNLFVYFGGSDRYGLTTAVLRATTDPEFSHLAITALAGINSTDRGSIHDLAKDRGRVEVSEPQPHLAKLMSGADLAFGAGGMTTWERMCVGLPSLVASLAANQLQTCEALAREGLIDYLGPAEQIDETSIRDALHQFLEDWSPAQMEALAARMKELVDGLGTQRIAAELELSAKTARGDYSQGRNILFLGPSESSLAAWLGDQEASITAVSSPLTVEWLDARNFDFMVSYGYRHIVSREILERFPSRAVNLHIGYLPWNRGSDPNLWSFIEDTPKGVTIHYMDEGLDTGDIIAQEIISFDASRETLATSYEKLQSRIQALFKSVWAEIRAGTCARRPQVGAGSYHTSRDRETVSAALTEGWDTPVSQLFGYGKDIASDLDR